MLRSYIAYSFVCHFTKNQQSANIKTAQDVDELIMGMASQIAERVDNVVVEDLRGSFRL